MDKVALVTGGARGIGGAIVQELGSDHAVSFTYFSGEREAAALVAELPDCLKQQADLSDPDAPQRIVARTVDRFGRIDLLVNNAASIALTSHESVDPAAHAGIYAMNVTAPAAILAAALPHMPPGASVVNIASINAARPPESAGVYAASKAALVAMTKSAAKALGPRGIRVNAVSPGLVERDYAPRPDEILEKVTAETPLGRVGRPEDIAPVVRFLASPAAGFMTGETLTVAGGYGL